MFSAIAGTAQGHLLIRISRSVNNLFRSVNEMFKVLKTAFLNLNRVREAGIEYRQLMMSLLETFVDFKTRFLLLIKKAGIPQSSRRLDLYDKLTVELQTSLVPVLSILTTFSDLYSRAIKVDQERKWISQRVVKAKAVKLTYRRTLPFIALVKQLIASYGSVTALLLIIKTRSPSPSPRVHFSDS
jgi:hypothetical protein